MSYTDWNDLIGQTLTECRRVDGWDSDAIYFKSDEGEWRLEHRQDCCENVYLEDVVGDLNDLVGSPILTAYETSENDPQAYDEAQWTFYHFGTNKGSVTVRFYGSSNGYYSVDASLYKVG